MPDVDAVREHYDRAAGEYARRFSRGPLGVLRAREWRVVRALLAPRRGESLLDAGSGPGSYAVRLVALGLRVRAVDLSPRMVEAARDRGVDASVADLGDLDLPERFDKVLCAGALEFCPEPLRVLSRLVAHLAPSGRLVLLYPTQTPCGRLYRAYHSRRGVRVRLFDFQTLAGTLERLGLEVQAYRVATPLSAVISAELP
ncbi:MAG: hypothetical protein AMXMBFR56_29750 [Polyangiaceae bacterium]